jgi:energy-coupling factor transport system substrate-specific component
MSAETFVETSAKTLRARVLDIIEPPLLVLVPVLLFVVALNKIGNTAILSALVAAVAVVPFFLRFEGGKAKPRDIMPVVIMCAIAVALRIIMTPLPNFKPVYAIIIITGVSFGRHSGFMTGALIALVSNLFMGQGPWTPWQMYLWGTMGYVAGALAQTSWFNKRWQVCVYSVIAVFVAGRIFDSYFVFAFMPSTSWQMVVSGYVAGLLADIANFVSTVFFLWLIYKPWVQQLDRIKLKYAIGE